MPDTSAHYHTLIHVGSGPSPLADYQALAEHSWLVDADPQALATLEAQLAASDSPQHSGQAHLHQALVSAAPGQATFYRYSLAWANGSAPISQATQALYPGLRCLESHPQLSTPIHDLLEHCLSQTKGQANLLLLDAGTANAELLQALANSPALARLAQVVVLPAHRQSRPLAVPDRLLGQATAPTGLTLPPHSQVLRPHPLLLALQACQQALAESTETLNERTELVQDLSQQQARQERTLKKREDAIAQQTKEAVRTQKTLEQLRQANQALKEQHEDALAQQTKETERTQETLEQLRQSHQALKEQHEDALKSATDTEEKLKQTHTWFMNRKQQAEEATERLKTVSAELKSNKEQLEKLEKLQERMEYLFEQQTLQREQAANALGQHVTHQTHATIDSVQTYIEAQKALGVSAQALSYDGKSLPHASALLLNRTLENGSYDVVLDIGSDVTTVFLASVLQQLGADQLRITQRQRTGKSTDGKVGSYTVAEAGELPKRLLGVTHSREKQQAMFNHLQHKGLEHLVDVQLSPLVEVYTADQTALFYDLTRTLQRLANLFHGRAARVLVVCAEYQQPESANTEVLLPLLLQYMASHTLEVVMLENQDEQASQQRGTWLSCLKARELPYSLKEDAKSHAWILTVNAV